MSIYLKRGQDPNAVAANDAKVRTTVEGILSDIQARGDAAVRELSEKFDTWSPESFRLSDAEIQEAIGRISEQDLEDIRFAQAQVRNFAQKQRECLVDLEVETMPGVVLGHKNIPVDAVGCYIPGGKYPMVASAHMSVLTAKVAGVRRVVACAPPFKGGPHPPSSRPCIWPAPTRSIASAASRPSAPWRWAPRPSPRRHAGRARQRLRGGGQASALRAHRHRPVRRAHRDADHRRRERRRRDLRHRPSRQAEHGPNSPCVLITNSEKLARDTMAEVERQLERLPTAELARKSWRTTAR